MRPILVSSEPRRDANATGHDGFSLVELLVASMLSLLIMGAVASLLGDFGRTVSDGRAVMELSSRLRNTGWRLRQDLAGLTCVPEPLVRPEANVGYFEVVEGSPPPGGAALVQDVDDVLALTTSSPSTPFTGRLQGAMGFESPTAEVIWYCEPSGELYKTAPLHNLYRRQLLVSATPEAGAFLGNVFAAKGNSDLSYGTYCNSLGDLSKTATRVSLTRTAGKLAGTREEDLLLRNVIAFDVQIVLAGATVPVHQVFQMSDTGDPAAAPIRGIDIRVRSIDPTSGTIREFKIVHSFSSL